LGNWRLIKNLWRIWCLALGDKAGRHNKEADMVALIRTGIFVTYFITNLCIVSGVIRHWNDAKPNMVNNKNVITNKAP
jgi:hypothetical protein